MFMYFLKNKSDSSEATERFLSDTSPFVKVKYLSFHDDVFPNGEIKWIRSDNREEYLSDDFEQLLRKNRIRHELTAPYSPHTNVCAERSWRTLFDTSRTLQVGICSITCLLHSKLLLQQQDRGHYL